jgi:hypothetical protein
MATLAVHEKLRAKVDGWTDVAGSNVFDSKGILINSSRIWPVPEINIADRAYFMKLATDPALEVAVEIVPSRLSEHSQAIVFARRISGPNREFLGVVTRAISPLLLETFFASASLGEDATIALHHRDGSLLARYPHVEALIGQNFKKGSALQRAFFDGSHLTGRLSSPIDGKDRLVSSRMLSSTPLLVVATRTVDSTLLAWRSQTKLFISAALMSLGVIAATLDVSPDEIPASGGATAFEHPEASARHCHQQHDARSPAVRCIRAADRMQRQIHRDVPSVA